MVIHAHPYREAWYIPEIRLFPESIDGVEVFNVSHYGRNPREDGRTMYDMQAVFAREGRPIDYFERRRTQDALK